MNQTHSYDNTTSDRACRLGVNVRKLGNLRFRVAVLVFFNFMALRFFDSVFVLAYESRNLFIFTLNDGGNRHC